MLRQTLLCTPIIATLMSPAGAAQPPSPAAATASLPESRVIDFTHVVTAGEPGNAYAMPALLAAIAAWLSNSFSLPASNDLPRVELTSPSRIFAMRYRQAFPQMLSGPAPGQALLGEGHTVVAVYDGANGIIYLPDGWTGVSPAEQSVLVHEMVHHLQHRAGIRFNCPEEREKLAYEAQDLWLAQFGKSLDQEFDLDPLTRLVLVNCMR